MWLGTVPASWGGKVDALHRAGSRGASVGAGEAAGRTSPEEAAAKEPGRQAHRQGAVSGKVRGTSWWQLFPSGTKRRAYIPPSPAPCYLEEGSSAHRSRGEQGHPDPRCRPGPPWAPARSEAESAGVTNRVAPGWRHGEKPQARRGSRVRRSSATWVTGDSYCPQYSRSQPAWGP